MRTRTGLIQNRTSSELEQLPLINLITSVLAPVKQIYVYFPSCRVICTRRQYLHFHNVHLCSAPSSSLEAGFSEGVNVSQLKAGGQGLVGVIILHLLLHPHPFLLLVYTGHWIAEKNTTSVISVFRRENNLTLMTIEKLSSEPTLQTGVS